ncbi:MAG TPA: hypothetical protein VKT72_12270 [Candidatus Baltobacteraceae bacterium]|nr:hypothetical protein [Candidatus Baltobacteraceae bacterium]
MIAAAISTAAAAHVFARASTLCRADARRLWGVSLCVPIMLTDAGTLEAIANRPVAGSKQDGNMFRLTLAAGTQIATAPFSYAGVRWAQIPIPMYGDSEIQAVTLMHESFHVVQPKLGFNGDADNGSIAGDAYLDTQSGRVWLRGELHALRVALQKNGQARKQALQDALTMRLYRHSLNSRTADVERRLDVLEGLAESTGIDAGLAPARRIPYALRDIAFVEAQPSYARSFAYATGPAYSELLDAAQPNWRRAIAPASDIAVTAARAYGLNAGVPSAAQAQAVIARYGGKEIEAQEAARVVRIAALDRKYKRELVVGPTLTLPMTGFHITFNPRDIETLDPYGSVYHTLRVSAPWGSIAVSGGDALISKDFRTLAVAAPRGGSGSRVQGDGWTLRLAHGYALVANPRRRGSYQLSRP